MSGHIFSQQALCPSCHRKKTRNSSTNRKIKIIGEAIDIDLKTKTGFLKSKELVKKDNADIFKDFIYERKADDKALGNLFYNLYPNECIYDTDNSIWYSLDKYGIYNLEGTELLSARTIIRDKLYTIFMGEIMPQIKNTKEASIREELIKFSSLFNKKISSVNQRKLIIEDLKEKYKMSRFREKCNNNKYIFAFDNGVYDLKTFKFRNAYPEEIVTDTCGYDYKPSTAEYREQVIKLLKNIFVDKDLFTYVMKVFALRLIRVNILGEFYFLVGPGCNGKGLLTTLIELVFGNFSQVLTPETFMKNKHGIHAKAANPAIASTYNSSIVFCCEPSNSMKITTDLLKRLLSNNKIKARFLREDFFEFVPWYAIFFVSNFDHIIDGTDQYIQRKCRYIPFLVKMTDNPDPNNKYERKIDRTLKEKIKNINFRCAFFDELVKYLIDFNTNDVDELVPPECVIKKTNKYLNENDPMKRFVDQMIEITNNEKDIVLSSELYKTFLDYNEGTSHGYDHPKFKKKLAELGIKNKHIKYGTAFYGIIVKDIIEV